MTTTNRVNEYITHHSVLLWLLYVPIQLQEHAARTLCTLLGANKELREKALQDGFLDKLQVKGKEGRFPPKYAAVE